MRLSQGATRTELLVAKGECEVKKIFNGVAWVAPVFMALAMFCSNPADKDLRWRTSVDLPITASKKFFLGAMMDSLFFNKQQAIVTKTYDTLKRVGLKDSIFVSHIDTSITEINTYPLYDSANKRQIPDTVGFGIPTHDTASDTISEDSLEDKYFEDVFGPIPISGTQANAVSIPLAGNYVAATPVATPPVPITVKYVYKVVLDTAQTLDLTVANNSSADFSTVQITLGTLGTKSINNLASNSTGTARFDVGGKEIDGTVNVTVSVTPTASGTFAAGDKLDASFSMNGLKATRVDVMDSLLKDFRRTFTNEYNLTDTVNVDYIDIATGFFIYSVTNYTGLDLLLSVTHRHLWRSDFCQGTTPPLTSINDLVGLTYQDSLSASNCDIAVREQFPANQTNTYSKHNISANRLFAEWNPTKKKSITKVDYAVNVGAYGRRVSIASNDSLQFVIRTTSFKFKEMFGHSTEQYKRVSDPSKIPVKLPWAQAVTDSLRGKFKLQKVLAVAKTRIDIPQGAFIDTMLMHYVLSNVANAAIACSSDVVLTHVMRDSIYSRRIDITNVVNDYPDSVKVNVTLKIPVNTTLKVVNDLTDPKDPSYTKFIGRMTINGLVDYNMVAPLCWTVVDTTILDLGGAKSDLGGASGVLDPLGKMTDTHGSLNMETVNFTNVYLKLYALAATDSAKISELVDTANPNYVKTNQFTHLLNNPSGGYINLLDNGILIPPRDSNTKVPDTVDIADADLRQILRAKTLGLRWQVRFIPHAPSAVAPVPDALYNTDWIKLNSWIHIDGVNSADSLFKF
jgi:hypothetical protein